MKSSKSKSEAKKNPSISPEKKQRSQQKSIEKRDRKRERDRTRDRSRYDDDESWKDRDGPGESSGSEDEQDNGKLPRSMLKKLKNEPSKNMGKIVIVTKGFRHGRSYRLDSTAL